MSSTHTGGHFGSFVKQAFSDITAYCLIIFFKNFYFRKSIPNMKFKIRLIQRKRGNNNSDKNKIYLNLVYTNLF